MLNEREVRATYYFISISVISFGMSKYFWYIVHCSPKANSQAIIPTLTLIH